MLRRGKSSLAARKALRAFVWLVFAAQAQLIFAAELHQHGYPILWTGCKPAISQPGKNPAPASSRNSVCLVCQIVRQSSARPAAVSHATRPVNRVYMHVTSPLSHFFGLVLITIPARAPPHSK